MTNTKSYNRSYYLKNKEKLIRNHLRWYYNNRETYIEYSKNYYKTNKDEVNAKRAKKRAELRSIIFSHYGEKCACCGELTPEFFTIDHINNNGAFERNVLKMKGVKFYNWIIKNHFPDGYQTLCYNCNSAKEYFGVCPHQKSKNLTFPTT